MTYRLDISDRPEPAAEQVIGGGLDIFNDLQVGYGDRLRLNVLVCDEAGDVVGGLLGRSSLGLMFIDLVYLPEALRGSGVGSRMLALAEEEAVRRGCRAGVLVTISFQAPDFYARHGWRRFGEVACSPPGTSRVFMTKTFSPPAP